jgi:hypothetical protein
VGTVLDGVHSPVIGARVEGTEVRIISIIYPVSLDELERDEEEGDEEEGEEDGDVEEGEDEDN